MTTSPGDPHDLDEMLRTIDARIRAIETMPQRSLGLIAQAREKLGRFRLEPIGGRLLRLKRVAFWFTASAFDRQSKVQDAVLDAVEEVARELTDVRNRIAILQLELERRAAGRDGPEGGR
jgi:hypothetical protein